MAWKLYPVCGEDGKFICRPEDPSVPLVITWSSGAGYVGEEGGEMILPNTTGITEVDLPELRLNPGVYTVRCFQNEEEIAVLTMSTFPATRFLLVSCDLLEADTKESLWNTLGHSVTPDSYLLHLGDQAYADACFHMGMKLLRGTSVTRPFPSVSAKVHVTNAETLIQESYRNRYEETWEPHRQVLASVRNAMMWDDHEIVNDAVVDEMNDLKKEKVASLASQVYQEYQLSLDLRPTAPGEGRILVQGDISIVLLDRTSTSLRLRDVQALLNQVETRKLLFCCGAGVIPPPHGPSGALFQKISPGKFFSTGFIRKLYTLFLNWLSLDDHRELVLAGGDLHFGTHGAVTRGELSFPVVISSPITNHPTPDRHLAARGMQGNVHMDTEEGEIVYSTIVSKAKRCFAVVDFTPEGPKVELVFSKESKPRDLVAFARQGIRMAG